jgi:copper homeostasis protein
MILEVIVTSLEEAIFAEQYGANRLEVIDSFTYGGLSPNLLLSQSICQKVKIPVNIMVRLNNDLNFKFNKEELDKTLQEISFIRDKTKANGIVIGALDQNTNIDEHFLQQVINIKEHLKITFHRAIDRTNNIFQAYHTLLKYPIDLVLTSGGKNKAIDALPTLNELNKLSIINKNNCKILVGSGIASNNLNKIITQTNINEIHIGYGVRNLQDKLCQDQFIKIKNILNNFNK